MRIAFLSDGERRADLYGAGAQRKQLLHLRRCGDAAGGNQGHLLVFDSQFLEHREGFFQDARKIKTRIVQVGDLGRTQMATRITRMLDDDGVGQARFAQPFLEHDGDAAGFGQDRDQGDIGIRGRQLRQIERQARTDHDRPGAGFAGLTHIGDVFRYRPHDVHRDQAIAAGNPVCRTHLAVEGKQIYPVDEFLVAAFCRLRHQVGMMTPQIHARQRADGAGASHAPRQPMRRDAYAHATLHNRQQGFSLDAQDRVVARCGIRHGGVLRRPGRGRTC